MIASAHLMAQSDEWQEQSDLITKIRYRSFDDVSDRLQRLDSLDKTGAITFEELKIEMRICNLEMQNALLRRQLIREEIDANTWYKRMMLLGAEYDSVIGATADSLVLHRRLQRHILWTEHLMIEEEAMSDSIKQFFLDEYEYLHDHGYRPEREGLSLGLSYARSNRNWLGWEIGWQFVMPKSWSFIESRFPFVSSHYVRNPLPVSASAFVVSFRSTFEDQSTDFTFSLFRLQAPLYINPVELGVHVNGDENVGDFYFYRPSIGIGWSFIQIYYSYEIPFLREDNFRSDRHKLNISIGYPILFSRYKPQLHK